MPDGDKRTSHKVYISDPSYAPEFPRFSIRTLLLAFLIIAPLLAFLSWARVQYLKGEARVEREKQTILSTLEATARETESIRVMLGRAPFDQDELQQLMGHPLPEMFGSPVRYLRTGPNSFQLAYLIEWRSGFSGDWLVFDSTKPTAGLVEIFD